MALVNSVTNTTTRQISTNITKSLRTMAQTLMQSITNNGVVAYADYEQLRKFKMMRIYGERPIPKTCTNETIVFNGGFDGHLVDNYSHVRNVVMHRCDKNFTYYNLVNNDVFPNVENIVITNHPCEPEVLHKRYKTKYPYNELEKQPNMYLGDYFYDKYVTERDWSNGNENVYRLDLNVYDKWFGEMDALNLFTDPIFEKTSEPTQKPTTATAPF